MMKGRFVVLVLIGLLLFGGFVSGFQGSSDSYSSDNRADSFSEKDASSDSFTQRLIGGIQVVGEYITDAFAGRFGILGVDKRLIINITSHQDLDEVVRGNDAVAGEDDKGSVPDFINFTAQVYDNLTSSGFSGASCYFYDNSGLFGNTTTNASGHCFVNWTKASFDVGFRNISVNYSIATADTRVVAVSEVNVSLVRYVSTLTMGNLRQGCVANVSNCYHDGDNATLSISIVKINSSGTVSYDPQNISANATNAAESVYAGGSFFYPNTDGNLVRTGAGEYEVNVTVDKTFGSQVRWDVLVSDSNFSDFISTAVHADAAICAGDFGPWSVWGDCNGVVETRSRTDSSDCTEVDTPRSCTTTDSCFPAGTKILMGDKSYKNIEDVRVGEEVKSYDLDTGEITIAKVLELEAPMREGFYSINNEINVTDEHPFYVLKENGEVGWGAIAKEKTEEDIGKSEIDGLEIYDIEIGDKFFTSEGVWESVETIEYYPGDVQTYNLKSVDEYNVFFANNFLVHNKGEACTPSWGDWSVCGEDDLIRTRSDGCGKTEELDCCIPTIICDDWSQCTPGFNELDFEESVDSNSGLTGNVINEKDNSVFVPLANGGAGGVQTKTCRDLNKCESDESWEVTNECIIGDEDGFIEFTPVRRKLNIGNNTRLNFEGDIKQGSDDVISINWYLNNEFQRGESLSGELTSSFSRVFSGDAVVKAELSIGSETQIEIWEIKINLDAVEDCKEKWSCDYEPCDGFYKYRIDETCGDSNACGTNLLFPESRRTCDCVPDYDCGDWGECNVDYDLTDILRGEPTFGGIQERQCEEVVGCVEEDKFITKEQECSLAVDVRVEKTEWCFEEYIEIYDIATDNLVSRVKERNVENIKRVDIGFLTTEFGSVCGYCFDHVENYDERGTDCGGQVCQECVEAGLFFDYLYFGKSSLWFLLLLALAYSAYKYRHEIVGVPKESAWKLRVPKVCRVSLLSKFRLLRLRKFRLPHLPRFRIPRVRVDMGRKRKVERRVERKKKWFAWPKTHVPRAPKPYAGLRSKLRAWKKKGYYETTALEHSLARSASDVQRSTRLDKERRAFERDEIRRERHLTRERKIAERERRRDERERVRAEKRRGRKRFFSSLFAGMKGRSEERARKKHRKDLERKHLKEERRRDKERKIREKEERRRDGERKREEKRRDKERRKEEKRRDKERRKAERLRDRESKKVRKVHRKGKGFFAGVVANLKRGKVKRVHRKEENSREGERKRRAKEHAKEGRCRDKERKKTEKRRDKERRKSEKLRNNERKKAEKARLKELKTRERVSRRAKHKSFFRAFFARRKHKKARKKVEKHERKVRKKTEKKRRKSLFYFAKHEKKRAKKEMGHYHRKLKRKEMSSSEASDLRRKLREWRKKGYSYGTTRLQKKLDKFEGKDVLE
ncbi:hypothetical protein CMI46_00140 [Candidatus Pacearchaeota archaeon]|nr:hypothetical protein [Candidatus Pacearchaeota archaeon]